MGACRELAQAGAAVVGLNCTRGPDTMLPILAEICAADLGVPIAGLPVGYNTSPERPTFQSLSKPDLKYQDLEPHTCTRFDFADFTKKAVALGVTYIGTCCGAAAHHVRAMAEAIGRKPLASANSADLSKHYVFGTAAGV